MQYLDNIKLHFSGHVLLFDYLLSEYGCSNLRTQRTCCNQYWHFVGRSSIDVLKILEAVLVSKSRICISCCLLELGSMGTLLRTPLLKALQHQWSLQFISNTFSYPKKIEKENNQWLVQEVHCCCVYFAPFLSVYYVIMFHFRFCS